MKLFNKTTNQVVDVDESVAGELLFSGEYQFVRGEKVPMSTPDGYKELSAEEAADVFGQPSYLIVQPSLVKTSDDYKREARQEDIAAGEGLLRGVVGETLGRGASKLYEDDEGAYVKRRDTTTGQIAEGVGLAASAFIPATKATRLIPGKALDVLGQKVATKAVETLGVKGVVPKLATRFGAQVGAESAFLTAEKQLSDKVHEGRDLFTLDNAAKVINSGLTGTAMGGAMGATAGAGYKAVVAVKQKSVDTLKKFATSFNESKQRISKLIPTEGLPELRFNIDKLDPSIGSTSAEFKIKDNGKVLEYSDGLNIVQLDGQKVLSKIPDLDNIDDINKLGMSLMPQGKAGAQGQLVFGEPIVGLGYVMDSFRKKGESLVAKWKTNFDKAKVFYIQRPNDQMLQMLSQIRGAKKSKIKPLISDFDEAYVRSLFDRRDQLRVMMSSDSFVPTKDFYSELKKVFNDLSNFNNKLNARTKYKAVKNYMDKMWPDEIKGAPKRLYEVTDGYKVGDTVHIFSKDTTKEALTGAFLNIRTKNLNNHKPWVKGVLNTFGAKSKTYAMNPKTTEKMADYILNALERDVVPNPRKLESALSMDRAKSISMMDSAVNKVDNAMDVAQQPTFFTGNNISKWIYNEWVSKFTRKTTGEILPQHVDFVEMLKKYMGKYSKQPADAMGNIIPDKAQKDWTVREINKLRKEIDKDINWLPREPDGRPTKDAESFWKSMREYLDDQVIKYSKSVKGGEEATAQFVAGKDLYGTVAEIEKMYGKMINREAAKRGMTGNDILITTALGIGGGAAALASSGSPLLGAVVAGAMAKGTKWTLGAFGDYWSSLLKERMLKNQASFGKSINTAMDKFFSKQIASPIISGISLKVSGDIYGEYRKEEARLNRLKQSLPNLNEDFRQNSQILEDRYPDVMAGVLSKSHQAVDILNANFPRPPNTSIGYNWKPSQDSIYRYLRVKQSVTNPREILRSLEKGYMSAEQISVLKNLYPEILERLKSEFYEKVENKSLSYSQRVLAARLFGYQGERTIRQMKIMPAQQDQQQGQPEAQGRLRQSKGSFSGQEQPETIRIENK